jgi:hypothetical protein
MRKLNAWISAAANRPSLDITVVESLGLRAGLSHAK